MPMQPRPIAETSGPFLPGRRLPTWNMFFSLFLFAEPPPRLRRIKWDLDALVTRGGARNDRQFGTADPKRLGEKLDHRFVRCAVRRRLGDPHLELVAPVRPRAPAADTRLGRARRHPDCNDATQSIATCCEPPVPTLLPRFMNNSSGSTAKVTIIISLKSSR